MRNAETVLGIILKDTGEPDTPKGVRPVRGGADRKVLQWQLAGRLLHFIIGFAMEEDARRVMDVLPKRFNRFHLTIHPEKTVLVEFKPPPLRKKSEAGKGTFDFLGFTHYWAKSRRGYWVVKRKTIGKRLRRSMKAMWQWCRANRHEYLNEQYKALCSKLRGYYQYYGICGNYKLLEVVCEHTQRAWRYWLSRRSQRSHISWQKFMATLQEKLPLPKPRIVHDI